MPVETYDIHRMVEFRKINEELDFLQKKVASLREINKLYPDTIITHWGSTNAYESYSLNKDADVIRFSQEKEVIWAYVSKIIGCVEVHSKPSRFAILMYDPYSMFTKLLVQEYRENMKKYYMPEELIRKVDLYVVGFIVDRNISIKNSNLDNLRNDDLKKLLILR